jgi:cytochrome b6-f complex iron-sulfur subunit
MVADLSRRAVLVSCGAACLSLLAGCTGSEPAAPAGAGTNGTGTNGTGTNGTGTNGTGPTEPAGFLARLSDVPVGAGAIVDSTVLVVHPVAGEVKAYDARCPHAGVIVGTPDASGVITCSGHFAHYRASDGSLIDGPSPRGLKKIEVRVADGAVLRA